MNDPIDPKICMCIYVNYNQGTVGPSIKQNHKLLRYLFLLFLHILVRSWTGLCKAQKRFFTLTSFYSKKYPYP